MITLVCKQCDVTFYRKGRTRNGGKPVLFCSRACHGLASRGSASYNFKGGRTTTSKYFTVIAYGHPRSHKKNRVYEHILIAERALGQGRHLPEGAEVHHVDGNGRNNTPSNLVICQDHAYHFLLEARGRRLRDTGSLDLKRCCICKEVKSTDLFYDSNPTGKKPWDGKVSVCKPCSVIRSVAYKQKRKTEQKNSL